MIRRFAAIARTAFVESLAEPLSAVLFLSSSALIHVLPVLHCHQFGEPGRLARECGLSSVLVFGLAFAVSAAVRTIGRELESGTASAALAHALPRPLFFCAKTAGVAAAFALFAAAAFFASSLAFLSSEVAADMAATHGENVRTWGPGLALGLGLALCAFAASAAMNRFFRWRFCLWSCISVSLSQPLALALAAFALGAGMPSSFSKLAQASVALAAGCMVFVSMAGAFAVRLKPAPVSALVLSAVALAFVRPVRAFLPDVNAFWFADRIANGGSVGEGEFAAVCAAGILLSAFWLAAGSALLSARDLP